MENNKNHAPTFRTNCDIIVPHSKNYISLQVQIKNGVKVLRAPISGCQQLGKPS